jgi:olfactory receptor
VSSLITFITIFFIFASYALVLRAVFPVPSAAGRHKAFCTCGAHLILVSLFYGSLMVMSICPNSGNPAGTQKIVTLIYSSVTLLVNPLIYSLQNKDAKVALRKLVVHTKTSQNY